MTGRERGFLLLTSRLGDPERRPLTVAQLRTLHSRARSMSGSAEDRDLTAWDLRRLGYDGASAEHILQLLSDEAQLDAYLRRGKRAACVPLTRVNDGYPEALRRALGMDAPGCLWAKGDVSLLGKKCVALVGSRELLPANEAFAAEVGRQAARQGYVLVSGNARGADRTAQESCLRAGGSVICVVADALQDHREKDRVLHLSEDSFDEEFTSLRALSRNRVIHSLGAYTFVAQSGLQTGGTWSGTVKNLRFGYSPVYCYDDGSEAVAILSQMGAESVGLEDLRDFSSLRPISDNLFTL